METILMNLTSNHPEKLDPALIRPGRVDKRFHLGLLTKELALRMCQHFLGESDGAMFFVAKIDAQIPGGLSPASLQNILLEKLAEEDAKIVQFPRALDAYISEQAQPTRSAGPGAEPG